MTTAESFIKNFIEDNFDNAEVQQLYKDSKLGEESFKEKLAESYLQLYSHKQSQDVFFTGEKASYVSGGGASSLFPITKDINFGVASFHIVVNQTSNDGYSVDVTSKILGFSVGTSRMSFENGTLHRAEQVGGSALGGSYSVNLKVIGGFGLQLEAHVWVQIPIVGRKSVDFGPTWVI
ncbi:hypothetical protein [Pseudomonas aeruginosa]|uniref:hypothetical protein n=1 Tax=Pseudomonas aeruginosa TaxID=287 RepID=UPI000F521F53|nr:hypothetical protein [Pseudomonas aeruginosa]MBG4215919.1 hypothetical protein [Pseudomonas aeruginosa]MBO7968749.1 hypothetical protein [Pseudomonas aeruginosa]MCO3509985.1 hypothetical protein [Pseudomonas aeruginosa]RTV19629.1 hypothetical protein DY986_13825 [Pseudomonas aeruginosa]TEG90712.1 hypothetical protein IPC1330_12705 [Pseudomonas aeruginosa]